MPEPELFLLFVRPLDRASIRYVVTGSVAAIFYGEPRLTHDVDFVVFLREADIDALTKAFPAADFYLPPRETIIAEAEREQRGHFNIIHIETGFKADMYLTGLGMLLTVVYLYGLVFRPRRQFGRMGIDSMVVLVLYVLGVAGLFVIR